MRLKFEHPAPSAGLKRWPNERFSALARRVEHLDHRLERRQFLAATRVRIQRRPSAGIEHARMRLPQEPQHACDRDIRMPDHVAEPEFRRMPEPASSASSTPAIWVSHRACHTAEV